MWRKGERWNKLREIRCSTLIKDVECEITLQEMRKKYIEIFSKKQDENGIYKSGTKPTFNI
jgi:hypothetical protein